MAKYRTKPFEIEATQWFKDNDHPAVHSDDDHAWVESMQGDVEVHAGDWIITEPDGVRHYPCKPEVFAAKYEPVAD